MMAQLLSLGLARIRQPKVIAEVLGGILLGTIFIIPFGSSLKISRTRSYCIWENTRVYRACLPFRIVALPFPRRQYRSLSLPFSRWTRNRHQRHKAKCAALDHRFFGGNSPSIRIRFCVVSATISSLHRSIGAPHLLYVIHRSGLFYHRLSCPLSHSDRTQVT